MTHRKICVYENPETSEVASEHVTLASALMCHMPPKPGTEVICNGYTLAREKNGDWDITADGDRWPEIIQT